MLGPDLINYLNNCVYNHLAQYNNYYASNYTLTFYFQVASGLVSSRILWSKTEVRKTVKVGVF